MICCACVGALTAWFVYSFKAVELSRVKDEKSLDFFFREVEVMRVRDSSISET